MRSTIRALGATTLFAAIACAYLWQQLRTANASVRQLQARIATLESAQRQIVQSQPAVPGGDHLQDKLALVPGVAIATASVTSTAPVPTPATKTTPIVGSMDLLKTSPDFRQYMRTSLRASMSRMYPNLAEELNLTPAQLSQLFDRLTDNQLALMETVPSAGADADTVSKATAVREELTRNQETELASMLGDVKYGHWKGYQQTLGARQQVGRLNAALESGEQPLSDLQRSQMIRVLADHQKQKEEEAQQASRQASPTAESDQVAMMEENLKRAEDDNRRVIETAGSYLSPQQLEVFRNMQNQNVVTMRFMLEAHRLQQDSARSRTVRGP
jgi:hypothetical protein